MSTESNKINVRYIVIVLSVRLSAPPFPARHLRWDFEKVCVLAYIAIWRSHIVKAVYFEDFRVVYHKVKISSFDVIFH